MEADVSNDSIMAGRADKYISVTKGPKAVSIPNKNVTNKVFLKFRTPML